MEESKEADPSLIDTDDVVEMADPHGDVGRGGKTQTALQSQHNVSSKTEGWETEVSNCVSVHVLSKDKMSADATVNPTN